MLFARSLVSVAAAGAAVFALVTPAHAVSDGTYRLVNVETGSCLTSNIAKERKVELIGCDGQTERDLWDVTVDEHGFKLRPHELMTECLVAVRFRHLATVSPCPESGANWTLPDGPGSALVEPSVGSVRRDGGYMVVTNDGTLRILHWNLVKVVE